MSSFQEVRIEGFHSIQRCPHLEYRGVSISGDWNREVPLYTEMSSFRNREVPLYTEVSSFQEVRIERFHCMFVILNE